MSKILQFDLGLEESLELALQRRSPGYSSYRILKKSIDARKGQPRFVYRIEVYFSGEKLPVEKIEIEKLANSSGLPEVLIVGTGPAGLFAALRLVERGFRCRIFERGSKTTQRMIGIAQYWRHGRLELNNNVCFGEGGAGLYSDGKLITRIKSPHIPYVLDRLVEFGAPEEIKYVSNPHVGSDKIRKLIPPLREHLLRNGCEIHFDTPVAGLLIKGNECIGLRTTDGRKFFSPFIVLATGHSASDVYLDLYEQGVQLEGKSFAIGFRIEHSQSAINRIQFKDVAEHPALGPATYRLTQHDEESGVGVYSFCMCPGGYVIASSTEKDGVVSNGMSNYARNSAFANSAVVVSVDYHKNFGKAVFQGLEYLRSIEKRAYEMVQHAGGTKQMPAQKLKDFLNRKLSSEIAENSSPSHAVSSPLHELFSNEIYERLAEAFEFFDSRRMRGFISNEAQLFGVETRTSAPIRIPRDSESLESVSHTGLYPTGEGAGYAGGITSAAVDGVRVAEAICSKLSNLIHNKHFSSLFLH